MSLILKRKINQTNTTENKNLLTTKWLTCWIYYLLFDYKILIESCRFENNIVLVIKQYIYLKIQGLFVAIHKSNLIYWKRVSTKGDQERNFKKRKKTWWTNLFPFLSLFFHISFFCVCFFFFRSSTRLNLSFCYEYINGNQIYKVIVIRAAFSKTHIDWTASLRYLLWVQECEGNGIASTRCNSWNVRAVLEDEHVTRVNSLDESLIQRSNLHSSQINIDSNLCDISVDIAHTNLRISNGKTLITANQPYSKHSYDWDVIRHLFLRDCWQDDTSNNHIVIFSSTILVGPRDSTIAGRDNKRKDK